jgi:hypothetical protein
VKANAGEALVLISYFAMIPAALFTGAAIYVNVAEQPARLALSNEAMLIQWKESYRRASLMQASLALLGGLAGIAAMALEDDSVLWLVGALVLLSAWPYTLLVIKRTNDALNATLPAEAGAETRRLVERWGRLHAVRSAIGVAATVAYLLALA